eukprot:1901417-Rhodomonas_salina.1
MVRKSPLVLLVLLSYWYWYYYPGYYPGYVRCHGGVRLETRPRKSYPRYQGWLSRVPGQIITVGIIATLRAERRGPAPHLLLALVLTDDALSARLSFTSPPPSPRHQCLGVMVRFRWPVPVPRSGAAVCAVPCRGLFALDRACPPASLKNIKNTVQCNAMQ